LKDLLFFEEIDVPEKKDGVFVIRKKGILKEMEKPEGL
jgi:hypothetical protein